MAINNTFLDEKGLRDLLAAIDKKFKSKKEIRIDAGFVPCKISPDGNGNLVVKDDTGRLVQNKFYWCDVPVKTIEFAPYETIDSKVVGEIMMYTPVASDAPDKTMTTSETWSWVGSDSVVKSNSKTLVTMFTNQAGLFVAEQKSYSLPSAGGGDGDEPGGGGDEPGGGGGNPNEGNIISENYIKVIYDWKSGTTKNAAFSSAWLNALTGNNRVFYSKNGDGAEAIGVDDLKAGLNVADSLVNKPYVIIEFRDNEISMNQMLRDIEFYDFELKLDSNKIITNISYAFDGGDTVLKSNKIDLSGIKSGNCGFTKLDGLFKNRAFESINLSNISTSKITSIKEIFYGSSFKSGTTIRGWDMSNCIGYEYAFYNTPLTNTEFLNEWSINAQNSINCSYMFSKTLLTDLTIVFDWINRAIDKIVKKAGSNTVPHVNLAGMFQACPNLKNVNNITFKPSGLKNKTLTCAWMFKECPVLKSVPLCIFEDFSTLDLSGMFQRIKSSGMDFTNFASWSFTSNSITSTLSLDDFFEGSSLGSVTWNSSSNSANTAGTFKFGTGKTSNVIGCNLILDGMFNNTSGAGTYEVYIGLNTGDPDTSDEDYDEYQNEYISIEIDGMLDKSNMDQGGIYYIYRKSNRGSRLMHNLISSERSEYKDYALAGIEEYFGDLI